MKRSVQDNDYLAWQCDQFEHDKRNHSDIFCLHKNQKLKHYALHISKYVGRLARGDEERKSTEETLIDATLVCLSTANTLGQRLNFEAPCIEGALTSTRTFLAFADAAGQFSDACEKIDHLEPYLDAAIRSNQTIFNIVLGAAEHHEIDFELELQLRRAELAKRQFFIRDTIE